MSLENFLLGKKAEKVIKNLYLSKKYQLIEQNFQYYIRGANGRLGEIDLIFEKDKLLVLVEVKSRNTSKFGLPQEQVTTYKLKCLYKAYQYFLSKNAKYRNYFCRFDLAVLNLFKKQVKIIPNAYNFDKFV